MGTRTATAATTVPLGFLSTSANHVDIRRARRAEGLSREHVPTPSRRGHASVVETLWSRVPSTHAKRINRGLSHEKDLQCSLFPTRLSDT